VDPVYTEEAKEPGLEGTVVLYAELTVEMNFSVQ
jgi:hypothetical protein